MSDPDVHAAFKPGLVLRFGITGHRPPRLDSAHEDTIKAHCREIFAIAAGALATIHARAGDVFAATDPAIKLVSSLAEGADVLAAEAVLESGGRLSVCLPFPEEVYRKDFGLNEWARTQALIDRADSVAALSGTDAGDASAYEQAGRIVLSQSDILIAVWDGEAARGRGGTTQVIAEAVALHQPVIHIDAQGRHPPELLWSGLHDAVPDRPSIDGVQRADARKTLPGLITALCEPPEGPDRAALTRFIDPAEGTGRRSLGWPLLFFLTGARSWRRTAFHPPTAAQSEDWMRPHLEPFAECGSLSERLEALLLPRFCRADARASKFALRFRSSFVTNFALAGIAVLLALTGLLIPKLKIFLIALELLVIALIIMNTRGANRINLHRLWLDHRHLAERMRLLVVSSALGRLSLRDVEDGTRFPGWVSWYARATARELGMVRTRFDADYLACVRRAMLGLIEEQVSYHGGNAHAMHRANHRLHSAGDWLFIGTILACAGYLTYAFPFGKPGHVAGIGVTEAVTFITALFPALAAALYGIRTQGDFAATGERSALIARQLRQLGVAIETDPVSYNHLAERSRRMSELMLAELGQWRLHYETRPLTLPG